MVTEDEMRAELAALLKPCVKEGLFTEDELVEKVNYLAPKMLDFIDRGTPFGISPLPSQ
jgi:hypothetical protein